jgi:hypothetical protein
MLYLSTPFGAMRAMFQQASDLGSSTIRVNIELSSVFPDTRRRRGALSNLTWQAGSIRIRSRRRAARDRDPLDHPRWAGVDEYVRLAHTYHLRVLAVLTSPPAWMVQCPRSTPSDQKYRCPPRDPGEWARAVGEIARHTGGMIDAFEILNEPDGRWSFLGTPQQYAQILAASYDEIHAVNPTDRVVLGGLMHLGWRGIQWMNEMLSTPGAYAAYKFDVANIHLRVAPSRVGAAVCQWRAYFAQRSFHGPLWVTETGYPANSGQQTDPGYENGPAAQSRWLDTVIPEALAGGVARIFVTERDLSHGAFASEGVLQSPNPLTASPHVRRRPSFYAVQRLARGGWSTAELSENRQAPSRSGC